MSDQSKVKENTWLLRFLNKVEKAGNKLPHPIILFFYGVVLVLVASALLDIFNITANDPRPEGARGRSADGLIRVSSLLSAEGLRYMLSNLVSNFVNFAPLGTVLVSLIGVGIAEKSGLIEASLKSLVKITPKRLITMVVVFAGVISNTAAELGYVVLIPLGAVIFYGFGKHPLAGMAAAFAGVSGGYSANLLLGTVDPLLSGLSQEAAHIIDPTYTVGPEANYYFMFISTFLVTILGTIVSEKLIEPMLGKYDPKEAKIDISSANLKEDALKPEEKKALIISGLFSLVFFVALYLTILPGKGILLNQTTMTLSGSPFFRSIVAFIFVFFAINGLIYGYLTKTFKSGDDVVKAMTDSMSTMSQYIILSFIMAQFIYYFGYTNIGLLIAVSLSDFVKSIGVEGSAMVIALIFMAAFINLFMGSASAKWALLAPVFVPMFMLLGYSPEIVQAAYRIGDSTTNIITPLMSYMGIILLVGQQYSKNFKLGSLMSLMLPFSIVFLIAWIILFYIWVFVLGLPVGPNAPTYFSLQ